LHIPVVLCRVQHDPLGVLAEGATSRPGQPEVCDGPRDDALEWVNRQRALADKLIGTAGEQTELPMLTNKRVSNGLPMAALRPFASTQHFIAAEIQLAEIEVRTRTVDLAYGLSVFGLLVIAIIVRDQMGVGGTSSFLSLYTSRPASTDSPVTEVTVSAPQPPDMNSVGISRHSCV
jgi:hypothetical protein